MLSYTQTQANGAVHRAYHADDSGVNPTAMDCHRSASFSTLGDMKKEVSIYRRFSQQRNSAKARGKDWLLSFEQWLAIWADSGHLAERGRKVGQYVMARHGDVGPYAVGNVSICLTSKNLTDSYASLPRSKRSHVSRAGIGRGWTYISANHRNPYQVICRGKYIGSFPSENAAVVAYAHAVEAGK